MATNEVQSAVVKFYNSSRGYGFLTDDSGNDHFFHIKNVKDREIEEGDKVRFTVGLFKQKPVAINIEIIET